MTTPAIDAYLASIGFDVTATEKAQHISDTPELLKERLLDARSLLRPEWRAVFKGATFDFAGKRLVAKNGEYALAWSLRRLPDQPEGYRNQQTNMGHVAIERRPAQKAA